MLSSLGQKAKHPLALAVVPTPCVRAVDATYSWVLATRFASPLSEMGSAGVAPPILTVKHRIANPVYALLIVHHLIFKDSDELSRPAAM